MIGKAMQVYRRKANLSSFDAAGRLKVAETTLRAYEQQRRAVPIDVAITAAEVYQAPILRALAVRPVCVLCGVNCVGCPLGAVGGEVA